MNTLKNKVKIRLSATNCFRQAGWFVASVLMFLASLAVIPARSEVSVERAERTQKNNWVRDNLLAPDKAPPFSFIYDGKNSAGLFPS